MADPIVFDTDDDGAVHIDKLNMMSGQFEAGMSEIDDAVSDAEQARDQAAVSAGQAEAAATTAANDVRGELQGYVEDTETARDETALIKSDFEQAFGGLSYLAPVEYGSGIEIDSAVKTVEYDGEVYAPLPSEVPFTTSGTFESDKFRLIQGVTTQQMESTAAGGFAANIGRNVIAVDSIADLLALPAGVRRGDLRYLVRGYHAGSDVGGGEFYWDATSTEADNGGTVFAVSGVATGRFKRRNPNRTTIAEWGATGDDWQLDDDAIDRAMIHVPAKGTLCFEHIPGTTAFLVNTPHTRTEPITVLGDEQHWIKQRDQSTMFHELLSVSRAMLEFRTSDLVIDGLRLDGNSPNNYVVTNGQKNYSAQNNIWNLSIRSEGPSSPGSLIKNIRVRNVVSKNPCYGSIGASGGMANGDGPYSYTADYGVEDIVFENCTVSEGQQSILYIGGGVRHGAIRNCWSIDAHYDSFRLYRQVLDFDIEDNHIIQRGLSPHTLWINDDPDHKIWRQGIRVGHNSNEPGTCNDIRVRRNRIYILTNGFLGTGTNQGAIRVSEGNQNIIVEDNDVVYSDMTFGYNFEGTGENLIVRNNRANGKGIGSFGFSFANINNDLSLFDKNISAEPANACFTGTASSGVRFVGNKAVKGVATGSGVYNLSSTVTDSVFEKTELIGYTQADFINSARTNVIGTQGNQFLESYESSFRFVNESEIEIPANTHYYTGFELVVSELLASAIGPLEISFKNPAGDDISDGYSYHLEKYIATQDAPTVTKGTAQSYVQGPSVSSASSIGQNLRLTVFRQGRLCGEFESVNRTSGNLEGWRGFFANNNVSDIGYIVLKVAGETLTARLTIRPIGLR